MSKKAIIYDWAAISRTFEYTSLGRQVKEVASYFHPIIYGPDTPAPTPEHQQLSDLLVALQPLVRLARSAWKPETAQRIAMLEAKVDAAKRLVWVIQTEGAPRPPSTTPLFD